MLFWLFLLFLNFGNIAKTSDTTSPTCSNEEGTVGESNECRADYVPEFVTPQVWNTNTDNFPEDDLDVVKKYKGNRVGLAFSGGGTRAASAEIGQLRGLNKLGLLEKTSYISAVSGGAWAAIGFSFQNLCSIEEFLGVYVSPNELTLDDLDHPNERRSDFKDENCFLHQISNSEILSDFIQQAEDEARDETYGRVLGEIFLRHYGIHDPTMFFSWSIDWIEGSGIDPQQFHFVHQPNGMNSKDPEKIPFLISLACVELSDEPDRIPIEYTPIYTGVRNSFSRKNWRKKEKHFGGVYVESFAYDSKNPEKISEKRVQVELAEEINRFALSDVMGSTGAAPQGLLDYLGIKDIGFPKFFHWGKDKKGKFTEAEEFPHPDGGYIDNYGIMPLLARKVEKIIVFINTNDPLLDDEGKISNPCPSIAPLFIGVPKKNYVSRFWNWLKGLIKKGAIDYSNNEVLEGGIECVQEIYSALRDQKEKNLPLVFRPQKKYRVKNNKYYGVEGGYEVDIMWIYNDKVMAYFPPECNEVEEGKYCVTESVFNETVATEEFKRFPFYRTFMENFPFVIDLTVRESSLLAAVSSWNIAEKEFGKILMDFYS